MFEDDDKPAGEGAEDEGEAAPVIETPEPTEGAQAAPETPQEGGDEAKPEPAGKSATRRVAHLQARASDAIRRAEEAERRAEAAEAMVRQQNGSTEHPTRQPTTRDEVVAEAQRIVAEERVRERRQLVIDAGVKEHGAETWNEKTAMLHTMGALARPDFMEALVDLPEAPALVVRLADDPDQLAALLAKRPAAMAAAMGRMAAEMAVAEKPKEISRAPPPVKPVSGGRAAPAPDPEKMNTKEYIAWRNQTAPKHLGGQGKAA
jgi:hypothetical protein